MYFYQEDGSLKKFSLNEATGALLTKTTSDHPKNIIIFLSLNLPKIWKEPF